MLSHLIANILIVNQINYFMDHNHLRTLKIFKNLTKEMPLNITSSQSIYSNKTKP